MDHAAVLFPMGLFLFWLVHQPGRRNDERSKGIAQRHRQHHAHRLPAENAGIDEIKISATECSNPQRIKVGMQMRMPSTVPRVL